MSGSTTRQHKGERWDGMRISGERNVRGGEAGTTAASYLRRFQLSCLSWIGEELETV
jgi:hypothetical protein